MSEKQEEKGILEVRMLGGFVMYYQKEKLQVGKKQTAKTLKLLQILLHAGDEGLSREELMECLFGDAFEGDRSNNLNVTVCSLRRLLAKSRLPKGEYICIKGGRYRFAGPLEARVDARCFTQLLQEAGKKPPEQALAYLKKACYIYGGHFLPELSGEEWAMVAAAHYQRLYNMCMEKLCRLMAKRREYEELYGLCRRAAALYPFGEWQVWQMECLLFMGRPGEAMALYKKTVSMYYNELNEAPSERMREFFRRMSSRVQPDIGNFRRICTELEEGAGVSGAYYCPYPSFVDNYHMAVRMGGRFGQPVCLLLCTISDGWKKRKDPERLKAVSERLAESIQESLSSKDSFTRYNLRQFLAMLPGTREEECPGLISRIDSCFRRREGSRCVQVAYRMACVSRNRQDGMQTGA